MVQRPGRKDNTPADGPGSAAGRLVGFLALAGAALSVFAAMVLLPAWASCLRVKYERDCLRAAVTDAEAEAQARLRQQRAAQIDPQYNKRIALADGMVPVNCLRMPPPEAPDEPVGAITVTPSPRPSPPPDLLLRAAARAEHPPTRRGLAVLVAGAIVTAMYLFSPPGVYRRRRSARR